ncbi:DUF5723 family protein [Pedobacter alpinus]|uniref:DUF5723 family protein n=1 Tax=Pedobacter alpinus TaxID=1590643 RepID=A0ABW5TMB6_9SPHI
MKIAFGILLFFLFPFILFAQKISLYHTGTQFDTFENPVQQGFIKDNSRKYAITLFPHIGGFINFNGDGETAFKKLLYSRTFGNNNIPNIGQGNTNTINGDLNLYLFNYKIFKTTNYNRELGFSLQFKNEGSGNITNETLAVFDSFDNFNSSTYTNPFNSNGTNQSYWQLGVTYRENYDERWAFGAKASLLSGLTYNKINVNSSSLTVNQDTSYTVGLAGNYISNFGFNELKYNQLIPNIKNLGAAISLSTSYTTKSDFYFTANLKDLGFIRWGKESGNYNFDSNITVKDSASVNSASTYFELLKDDVNNTEVQKYFYSSINTKVEFAASKEFGFYKPVFVVSKSIFNPQGQIGLLNNLKKNAFVFSFNAIYDLQTKMNFGSQMMIKSANAEFYVGSEQIFPSYYLSKSFITQNENIGRGNPRADIYIGINVKFGPKMQNIGTADEIPGLNHKETGYVVRLSKKELKRLQKKNQEIEKNRSKNDKRNFRR